MTQEDSIQLTSQAVNWAKSYGVDPTGFVGLWSDEIGDNIMGLCSYHYDGARRYVKLHVTYRFKEYPLAAKCVLWHEYCHGDKWVKEGKDDPSAHGSAWKDRCWRKPILFILDYTYCKILFLKLRIKG